MQSVQPDGISAVAHAASWPSKCWVAGGVPAASTGAETTSKAVLTLTKDAGSLS